MGAKKMGRPTDSPKVITVKTRFDKETAMQLEECSQKLNITKAEVVRRSVKKMHQSLPK